MNDKLLKQCAAGFIGMAALIFTRVGAIYNNPRLPGGLLAGMVRGKHLIRK
jgi:hypothetical protein